MRVRKAVIDVGSNSVLLLVAERHAGAWHPIKEATAVTALGQGTKETGLLGDRGMRDTLQALAGMFAEAGELGCESVVAAATMAARIATNVGDFLTRAIEQGTPVMVLSGNDEAQHGFESVTQDPRFAECDRITIIDPGGHSTELQCGERGSKGWSTEFKKSFPVGTLGLRGSILRNPRCEPLDILNAIQMIDDLIGHPFSEPGIIVVLGATGTNLISIREMHAVWTPSEVHGAYLMFEEVSRAVGWMMPMSDEERAEIIGMEPGRERTIHIGALILERFLYAISGEGCYVSVRGWRHALLEQGLPADRIGS